MGLGEILCDILPEGRQLGGARANFAYFSELLVDRGIIASRVCTDILGEVARDRIEGPGIATTALQSDAAHLTDTAKI